MTDVDAVTKLLDLGFNAVFLFLLWRVYQDFMIFVKRHADYIEKLVDRLLPEEEPQPAPQVQAYKSPWTSRTPTNINEPMGGD